MVPIAASVITPSHTTLALLFTATLWLVKMLDIRQGWVFNSWAVSAVLNSCIG
jgi:hypothetical protein